MKLKLKIAMEGEKASDVTDAIVGAAHTGKIGEGKIFAFDLPFAMRIRTGETGNQTV